MMNTKRGLKRTTFALAVVSALLGTVIGVSVVFNKHEKAQNFIQWKRENFVRNYGDIFDILAFEDTGEFDVNVIPEDYSGNVLPFEMIGTIEGGKWHNMSESEKIAAIQAYNTKRRNELKSGFWIQLSKPSLVALCIAGGMLGTFVGFSSAWLILWFGGLAIYKIIKLLILGFCDEVNRKHIEGMESRQENSSTSPVRSQS
ncbi:MAG: hypothetical protein JSV32_08625 [Dehalococcoidia bacterium]|nr:MAG: hypothetical protein JSV32_08625 [Dehalococcoidia bacterium]